MASTKPEWHDLVSRLSASTELKEITGIVLALVRYLQIPFQSCVVLIRERKGEFTAVLSETPYRDVLAMSHLLQLKDSVIEEVIDSGRARLARELPENSNGRIFKDELSAICVPLMIDQESLGVIYVGAVASDAYTLKDLQRLGEVGTLAGPSLHVALPAENRCTGRTPLQIKTAQLDNLREMARKLNFSASSSEILKAASTSIRTMVPKAQSIAFFSRDPEDPSGQTLRAEFADSPYSDSVRNLVLRDDEGPLAAAIRRSSTILIPDTKSGGGQDLLGSEHSMILAPLWASSYEDGESEEAQVTQGGGLRALFGCLYVGAAQANSLSYEHRDLIETISYHLATALEKDRLHEQIQHMTLTDSLTGLYSHRVFQDRLHEEIEYAARHDQSVVLAMVDADNFKAYNERLGYAAGDALLQEIAELLKDKVRAADIVCRYGGDEFALLLKNTRKEDAARLCERIREAFQLRFGGNLVQVTSSIGLACYPIDADSKKDLAQAADDALYVSKRNGRNKVSVSKTLRERRESPPMVHEVISRRDPEDPPWQHPHPSPRKPPPKNVPGQESRKIG